MGGIGNPLHLLFIAVVALLVLGPKRLPDLARSLGSGMREFRESISGMSADHESGPEVAPLLAETPAATEHLAAASTPPPPVSLDPAPAFDGSSAAGPAPAPAVAPPPPPVDPAAA